MPNTIIHIQTTVNAIFGELDGDGNVVRKIPINLEVPKLSEDIFREALAQLLKAKAELSGAGEQRPQKKGKGD